MKKTMLTLGLAMCTVATLGASVNQISAAKDPNYGGGLVDGTIDEDFTIPGELEEIDPMFPVEPNPEDPDIIGPDTEMGKDENIDPSFPVDQEETKPAPIIPVPDVSEDGTDVKPEQKPECKPEQKPECKPGEGSGEMTGKPSDKNNKVNTTTKGTVASTVVAPEADLNTVNTGDSTQAAVLLGSMTAAAGTIVAVSKKRFAKN